MTYEESEPSVLLGQKRYSGKEESFKMFIDRNSLHDHLHCNMNDSVGLIYRKRELVREKKSYLSNRVYC